MVDKLLSDIVKVTIDYEEAPVRIKPEIDTGDFELLFKAKEQVERPKNALHLTLMCEGKRVRS
jgi:hypothetical protein